MTTDLISLQNKVSDLSKRARDLSRDVKYHTTELKDLKAGKYNECLARDPEFVTRNTVRHTVELAAHQAKLTEITTKIAGLEASRVPVATLPHADLLAFFSGNGLDAARAALELLAECLKVGSWVPHASRRVDAGLNPAKVSKKNRAAYEVAFAPLAKLFREWNSTRPQATFTNLGASPTVTATVKSLDAVKVDVCPIEWIKVEGVDKHGRPSFTWVGKLLWPAGTKHGTSKYDYSAAGNNQCQACGHAIKNAFNWVPLILTDAKGATKSLWVGRDCAETLFGIKLVGELELVEGSR